MNTPRRPLDAASALAFLDAYRILAERVTARSVFDVCTMQMIDADMAAIAVAAASGTRATIVAQGLVAQVLALGLLDGAVWALTIADVVEV